MKKIEPARKLSGKSDILWVVCFSGFCAIFGALLLHYLEERHNVYRLGYEIAEQAREHELLLEENRRLMVEAAVQSRPERLEEEAVDRLGLSPPVSSQIIRASAQ